MEAELHKLRIDKSDRANRHQRSVWPIVLIVLLLLGGGALGWRWYAANGAPVVTTVRVRPSEGAASDRDMVILNATGYVMAAHKIELASKVVGRVAWVGVEMGDKIDKGEVLVRLEDDEYKARVAQEQGQLDNAKAKLAELEAGSRPQEIAQSQAALDQAQAELNTAELSWKRMKDVEGTNSVSKQQIDDAEGLVHARTAIVASARHALELTRLGPRKEQIDAQRATVRQLEGALAMAQLDLDNTIIRSSIPATVLERNVEVGEFVTTGFVGDRGAKGYVVSIADLNDLRVELDISQNDFAKVVPKGPCWIVTDAYPDKKYQGVVDLISPEANRQKATVLVRVKVLNPDELLKPDMNATVSFLSMKNLAATQSASTNPSEERPAIRVPSSAVRDGAVFVVEDGHAIKRTVTVGRSSAKGEIEIRKGLIGGEDLIVAPPAELKDGGKVKTE
ncbi:efflux RND transporter periplasmic adaptor subunit [soil metagenome]